MKYAAGLLGDYDLSKRAMLEIDPRGDIIGTTGLFTMLDFLGLDNFKSGKDGDTALISLPEFFRFYNGTDGLIWKFRMWSHTDIFINIPVYSTKTREHEFRLCLPREVWIERMKTISQGLTFLTVNNISNITGGELISFCKNNERFEELFHVYICGWLDYYCNQPGVVPVIRKFIESQDPEKPVNFLL